jgi:hypothetical protein
MGVRSRASRRKPLQLLSVCSTESLFANAGQAEVERALMRALLETDAVDLRLLVHGTADGYQRVREYYSVEG